MTPQLQHYHTTDIIKYQTTKQRQCPALIPHPSHIFCPATLQLSPDNSITCSGIISLISYHVFSQECQQSLLVIHRILLSIFHWQVTNILWYFFMRVHSVLHKAMNRSFVFISMEHQPLIYVSVTKISTRLLHNIRATFVFDELQNVLA